jgi:predicted transcriptional regulator
VGHMHPMCAGAHSTGVRLLIATALIGNIHDALNRVASGSTQQAVEEPKAPAVPIKKSVQPDYIVCLDARYTTFFGKSLTGP